MKLNYFKKDLNEFINGFKTMFSDLKNKKTRTKQMANLLTLSRVGIACFIPPLALSGNLILASLFTILAASTDAFDGLVARKFNATSEFGKNLDPVCDKLFAGILIVPLMMTLSPILVIGLSINLILEANIAMINLNSKIKGHAPKTSIIGKIKTTFLSILLASLYVSFSYNFNSLFIPIVYALATSSQVIASINYYLEDKKKTTNVLKTNTNNHIKDDVEIKKNDEKEKVLVKYTSKDYKDLKEEINRCYGNNDEMKKDSFQKKKK